MSKLPVHLSQNLPVFAMTSAAAGNENVTANDLKIPMLKVLQQLSPELDDSKSQYIEGAKAGMIANTVTGDASTSVMCMNLYFKSSFVVWLRRELGGGKVGEFDSLDAASAYLAEAGLDSKSHDIIETATHYVMLLNDDGSKIIGQALIPMSGTGLSVSSTWNSNIQMTNAPQRFLSVWKLSTVKRSNSKGSWFVFDPTFAGFQQDQAIFEAAMKTYSDVSGIKLAA